ncbi:hypothetical protein F5H01DRAFT_414916 [Linnemannia elongata]|nr:hypothetical protein F5H01DRAFT_414916 [Linnemannia elongata]
MDVVVGDSPNSLMKLLASCDPEYGLTGPTKANQAPYFKTNCCRQYPYSPTPTIHPKATVRVTKTRRPGHTPSQQNKAVHIAAQFNISFGSEVFLWSNVLVDFRGLPYLQHDTKVIPFLKGNDLRDLDPLRLACVPKVTLEVVLGDVHTEPGAHSSLSQ